MASREPNSSIWLDTNISNNTHSWFCNQRKLLDLTKATHTHFNNTSFDGLQLNATMFFWQTNFIVKVFLSFQTLNSVPSTAATISFVVVSTRRTSNSHYRDIKGDDGNVLNFDTLPMYYLLQCKQCRSRTAFFYDCTSSTLFDSRINKIMTIKGIAFQGYK